MCLALVSHRMVAPHILGLRVDLRRIRKTLLIGSLPLLIGPRYLEVLLLLLLVGLALVLWILSSIPFLIWPFALLGLRRLGPRLRFHLVQNLGRISRH